MASLKSPSLVLDASAVVRIIEGSSQAAAFQQVVLESELVLAPKLMLTEVSNALWRLQRACQLQLVDHIEPDRQLQVEPLAVACHLDHPVGDCLHLSLATQVLP